MGETLVVFVLFKNGQETGCQNAYFDNMDKVEEKAKLYKSEHPCKPDSVVICVFNEETLNFDYLKTV
jgi:hypothetical protein